MYFLSALIVAGIYTLIRKRGKIPWFIKGAVLFASSCLFALSDVGQWLGLKVFGGFFHAVGSLIGHGVTGAAIATGVMILLLLGTILDIAHDRKIDKIASAGLTWLPVLCLAAAGPVAAGFLNVTNSVAVATMSGFTHAIGL